jgi:hypothetical protein
MSQNLGLFYKNFCFDIFLDFESVPIGCVRFYEFSAKEFLKFLFLTEYRKSTRR